MRRLTLERCCSSSKFLPCFARIIHRWWPCCFILCGEADMLYSLQSSMSVLQLVRSSWYAPKPTRNVRQVNRPWELSIVVLMTVILILMSGFIRFWKTTPAYLYGSQFDNQWLLFTKHNNRLLWLFTWWDFSVYWLFVAVAWRRSTGHSCCEICK